MPPQRFTPALALLLQSHDYARDLDCDRWDLAVEANCLREAGLTNSDLRWLLAKGFLAQAVEIVPPPDGRRRAFLPLGSLVLDARSCFLLTSEGLTFARAAREGEATSPPTTNAGQGCRLATTAHGNDDRLPIPSWDKDRRVLQFRGQIVKQFKVPAANQEIILAVFEEENWAHRIDDPLPAHDGIEPKRRLHDAINSLNRNQRGPLLHFLGDGKGQGICWEAVDSLGDQLPSRLDGRAG
jgi:hypothetical protein